MDYEVAVEQLSLQVISGDLAKALTRTHEELHPQCVGDDRVRDLHEAELYYDVLGRARQKLRKYIWDETP